MLYTEYREVSMGDDFTYRLFFPRQEVWPVLEDVAVLSDLTPDHPLRVLFPNHERSLPFEPFGDTPEVIAWDEPYFEVATSLCFEPDEVLLEYQQRENTLLGESEPPEAATNGVPIGFIYLHVNTRLPDTDNTLIVFSTPGSSISHLFRTSVSIRKTFTRLLRTHHGICGVFDTEIQAEVFWWMGRSVKKVIEGDLLQGTDGLSFHDFEAAMQRKSLKRSTRGKR